jgi:hypothetical protein
MEILKMFYAAVGAPSYPIASLVIVAILGATASGGLWLFIGKLYANDQAESRQKQIATRSSEAGIGSISSVNQTGVTAGVINGNVIINATSTGLSQEQPRKVAIRDKTAIGFTLIKRGVEPELHMLLRPEERGDVTSKLDAGWPDHYTTETFLEFPLTDELRMAEHVELHFDISRTSSSTYAGNVSYYSGTGAANIYRFGAGSFLTRIELTKDSFEINITQLVKQYAKDKASFIGFRFYNPEAATNQTKQFYVLGGHIEVK